MTLAMVLRKSIIRFPIWNGPLDYWRCRCFDELMERRCRCHFHVLYKNVGKPRSCGWWIGLCVPFEGRKSIMLDIFRIALSQQTNKRTNNSNNIQWKKSLYIHNISLFGLRLQTGERFFRLRFGCLFYEFFFLLLHFLFEFTTKWTHQPEGKQQK